MNAEIRELKTLEEFQRCVEIQKIVWGFDDPYDIAPLPLLMIAARTDGIVLGAFKENELIGFVYSLPGTHKGRRMQWSHMLAIVPEYRNFDLGFLLKKAQFDLAEQKGYEFLEWTFDPLESRNAYFNLKKLGCIAKEYEVNVYGITSSPLHGGMPTDRLIAHSPVPALVKILPQWTSAPEAPALVTTCALRDGLLQIEEVRLDSREPFLFLELPEAMQELRAKSFDAALQWRLKTREVFVQYLSHEYLVYSFLRIEARNFYVLKKV